MERAEGFGVERTFKFGLIVGISPRGISSGKASTAGPHEKPIKLAEAPDKVVVECPLVKFIPGEG